MTAPGTTARAYAAPRRTVLVGVPLGLGAVAAVLLLALADGHGGFDLEVYRGAVRAWLDGAPLYDYAHPGSSRRLGFTYPPFAALLLAPLAVLPDALGTAVHLGTGVAALVVVLAVVGERAARAWSLPRWWAVACALPVALLLEPVRDSLGFGQVNLQLAALVVADLVLLRRGSRWAGVGTGLATAVKLTPGLLLVHLWLSGSRRAAVVGAAVAGGATLLAGAVAPQASWDFWTGALHDTSRVGSADSPSNQALSGLLARLLDREEPPLWLWLPAVAVVLAVGLRRAVLAVRAGDDLAGLALAGVTGALVSPITWVHHLWWVLPVLAVLLAGRRVVAAGAVAGVFALSLPDAARVPLGEHLSSPWTVLGESALVLVLLAVLVRLPVEEPST